MGASLKQLSGRISSVGNTKKITDAMKLVAAAKVRRAQDNVINGRPFAENLVKARSAPYFCPNVLAISRFERDMPFNSCVLWSYIVHLPETQGQDLCHFGTDAV